MHTRLQNFVVCEGLMSPSLTHLFCWFCSLPVKGLWMQMGLSTLEPFISTLLPGSAMILWHTLPRRPTSVHTLLSGSTTIQTPCPRHASAVSPILHPSIFYIDFNELMEMKVGDTLTMPPVCFWTVERMPGENM